MLLSVIIVNYNVKYFLEQCLRSLQAALTSITAEVIVIDNCSTDGSIAYLRPLFPQFTFIQNNINEGFAKANNKAVQLATGEYILFLNPDTVLAEDTLQQCLYFFTTHHDAGAVGVRMIDGSGTFLPESKRAFPSPLVSLYKLTGLAALFPKSNLFNRYALGGLPEKEVHRVDVLAGAFMLVKKSVLDKTGSFDEQFFMYAEDIDLSYRIQKAGFKNYYLGNVTIVHFKGESTAKGSLQYVRIFYEAMRLFVKKHYTRGGAWFINKGLHAGIVLRQMAAAITLPFYRSNKRLSPIATSNVYITGDEVQIASALNIIKKNFPDLIVKHVKSISSIPLAKIAILVFCFGDNFSYKEAIDCIQSHPDIALLMWHGKDTNSIVSSNNKNAAGSVWY